MNTFKEGDRVTHPIRGIGTVVDDIGSGWFTVKYDKTGERYMTDVALLTPEPKTVPKFRTGDRVSHGKGLHRDGTVEEYDEHSGLYTVGLGGSRAYRALEHQITLAKPEPKFTLTVTDSDGFTGTVGPFPKDQIDAVLTGGFDWDTVESITINRVKG